MRIQMESTDIFTHIDGVPVHVWNAITEDGQQCVAFVASLAFRADQPLATIEAELKEIAIPEFTDKLRPRV